jgi:hypothetical protein
MASIITTLENEGHAALTAIQHGAAWLVGKVASAETALASLTASDPIIAEAVAWGEAAATAHGIPIVAVENIFTAIMAAAQELVAGLTAPPPAPVAANPATPLPADPAA